MSRCNSSMILFIPAKYRCLQYSKSSVVAERSAICIGLSVAWTPSIFRSLGRFLTFKSVHHPRVNHPRVNHPRNHPRHVNHPRVNHPR
jgi:hypothetical protein